jgi:hypothetical protein
MFFIFIDIFHWVLYKCAKLSEEFSLELRWDYNWSCPAKEVLHLFCTKHVHAFVFTNIAKLRLKKSNQNFWIQKHLHFRFLFYYYIKSRLWNNIVVTCICSKFSALALRQKQKCFPVMKPAKKIEFPFIFLIGCYLYPRPGL